MSKSSASTTLILVPDIGTFNPYLLCNKGEIWQEYTGTVSAPTCMPDFSVAGNERVLTLVVNSSRGGSEIPDKVDWYFNGLLIGSMINNGGTYSGTLSTDATISGLFELVAPTTSAPQYGLKIKGNLVKASGGTGGQITARFIPKGETNIANTISISAPFSISESKGSNVVNVKIEPGDTKNFQILTDNGSCILKAVVYRMGKVETASAYTYQWYLQDSTVTTGDYVGWSPVSGATSATYTITDGDIESSRQVMCVAKQGGEKVGSDIQIVLDATDTYEVGISRTPSDGQVRKAGDKVDIACSVYRRGNATPLTLSGAKWTFTGYTAAGAHILTINNNTTGTCSVTYNDIYSAGGQLEFVCIVDF